MLWSISIANWSDEYFSCIAQHNGFFITAPTDKLQFLGAYIMRFKTFRSNWIVLKHMLMSLLLLAAIFPKYSFAVSTLLHHEKFIFCRSPEYAPWLVQIQKWCLLWVFAEKQTFQSSTERMDLFVDSWHEPQRDDVPSDMQWSDYRKELSYRLEYQQV